MNALVFKKCMELKNSKLKLASFFVSPFICFLACCYFNVPKDKMAIYFPLAASLFNPLVFWSQENMYLSGDILLTPLSPKKAWIVNSFITSVSCFIYTSVCFLASILIYAVFLREYIPLKFTTYGLLNLILVVSITLFSSLSNVENTTAKQWIAAPVSLFIFLSFPILLFLHNFLPSNLEIIWFLNLSGLFLVALALLINKNIKNEKILTFSDKILTLENSCFVE